MSLSPIAGVGAVQAGARAFETASARLLNAVSPESSEDPGAALADMSLAKAQFRAGLAVISYSSDMWDALIEAVREK